MTPWPTPIHTTLFLDKFYKPTDPHKVYRHLPLPEYCGDGFIPTPNGVTMVLCVDIISEL